MSFPQSESEADTVTGPLPNPASSVESDAFVQESDVPLRAASLRREDLVPFVKQGFVAEMTADSPPGSKVGDAIGRSDNMKAEKLMSAPFVTWPTKYDVLGVEVSATDYDDVVRRLAAAARSPAANACDLRPCACRRHRRP